MSDAKITISAEDRTKAVIAGVKASLGDVKTKGDDLNNSFGKLGGVLGSAFVGLSFTAFVKSTAAGVDALNDIKDATGASIENISALEDTALRTGTSLDTVTTSLVKFNQTLGAAVPGSDQERALKAIGLSAADLRKQDPAEALVEVAKALSTYADDGDKARLVQELFGKSIKEVAPLLNDLAEKGKLVATITTEQALEAEKFNKQLAELEKNSLDLARRLTNSLVPALNDVFAAFKNKGARGGVDAIGAALGLDAAYYERRNNIAPLEAQLAKLQKDQANAEAMLSLNPANLGRVAALQKTRDAAIAGIEDVNARLATARATYLRLTDGAAGGGRGDVNPDLVKPRSVGPLPDKPVTAKAEQITEAQSALAAYVRELQNEIDKVDDLTDRQKALDVLKSLGATGEQTAVRELVLGRVNALTVLKQEEAIRKNILENAEKQLAADKALDDAIESFAGRTSDALKASQAARLEARLAAGEYFSPEELQKIVKGIAGIKDEVEKELGEMDELTKQFARNVQDALGQTVEDTLRGDFDNIGKLWGDLLIKMAAQAIAADLGKSLFGNYFGNSGSGAGQLGGALGSLFGGGAGSSQGSLLDLFASFGGSYFAAGGDHTGGLRIVGEKGPELEATGPSRIYSADQTRDILAGAGQGGAPVVNNTNYFGGGVSRNELVAYGEQLRVQIKADVMASMSRPGGYRAGA